MPGASYSDSAPRVAEALRRGALVIFPTETVYGIAANAALPEAIARLRRVKGRADSQPFTVHLGRSAEAESYVSVPNALARRFARKAWPGPLTLICEAPEAARTEIARRCEPAQLSEIFHSNTVGLRVPDHPAATALLAGIGVPIVASSANRAGRPPPLEFAAALAELDGEAEFAIDGGRTRLSAASTIVELRGNAWSIRRAGVLDERTIRRMATSETLFVCTGNSCRSPLAEYLFRKILAERLNVSLPQLAAQGYAVSSAGTSAWAGGAIASGSRDELTRRGIDASGHRSQPLTVELIQRCERIFVMSGEHREIVLELAPAAASRVHLLDPRGPVTDPIGGGAADYAACAAHIENAVRARVEEFLDEDRHW